MRATASGDSDTQHSLGAASSQLQHQPGHSQLLHSAGENLVNTANIPMERFPTELSNPLISPTFINTTSLGVTSGYENATTYQQHVFKYQPQGGLLSNNPSQANPQLSRSTNRKRAPKAPTMSDRKWKPDENRIRELYSDEKGIQEELRRTINEKFGFAAT